MSANEAATDTEGSTVSILRAVTFISYAALIILRLASNAYLMVLESSQPCIHLISKNGLKAS